ncbi:MAG: transcriptional regulator, Fis family, partial [Deltaproteobacteria bacterium]|nr:transcriptional regulator, Fis family [Deltaproteobacteria bacterium]
ISEGPSSNMTLEEMEKRYIEDILKRTGWRIKGDGGAAHIIGMNPSTLYSRMKKLGISSQHENEGM